jgi:hypothetical protein
MAYSKYYIAGTNKPAGNPIHREHAAVIRQEVLNFVKPPIRRLAH